MTPIRHSHAVRPCLIILAYRPIIPLLPIHTFRPIRYIVPTLPMILFVAIAYLSF